MLSQWSSVSAAYFAGGSEWAPPNMARNTSRKTMTNNAANHRGIGYECRIVINKEAGTVYLKIDRQI